MVRLYGQCGREYQTAAQSYTKALREDELIVFAGVGKREHEEPRCTINQSHGHLGDGAKTDERMYSAAPVICAWWKYPESSIFPAGSPVANMRKNCKEPIQLMFDDPAVPW